MGFRIIGRAAVGFSAILALSACVTDTSPSGTQRQYDGFVVDAVTAEVIAENCPSIRMGYSRDTLVRAYVEQMLARGHSPIDVAGAASRANEDVLALEVATRITRNVPPPGNAQAYCAYGQAEMARATRIGSFLR